MKDFEAAQYQYEIQAVLLPDTDKNWRQLSQALDQPQIVKDPLKTTDEMIVSLEEVTLKIANNEEKVR